MLKTKKIRGYKSKCDMAASFQETINQILKVKTAKAMEIFLDLHPMLKHKNFVVAGGVAS
ncbi:MAG: tRNA (adenosine(37)-N6)-threonylcarbamoyltransferase complex transferase subunit TsaD, partial [Rickettsiales bacterium]|nr:tRNA (adenosine(37)-N6)-threonylcarbamoyltransferase complex transferase subunit TsaD [Rickettsiales bacterium]